MKELREKELLLRKKLMGDNYGLGVTQAFELGSRSSAKCVYVLRFAVHAV